MSICYIGLGSNLNAPDQQLRDAKLALENLPNSQLQAVSSMYRSPAMTLPDSPPQPDYFNAVIQLQTTLLPYQLLASLHTIEQAQGRQRNQRWAARSLDLDILLYDDLELSDARLVLPHPGIAQRNFVLYPLHEIAPQLVLPRLGKVDDLLAALVAENAQAKLQPVGAF